MCVWSRSLNFFVLFCFYLDSDGKTELCIVNHAIHYKDFNFYFTDVLQKSPKNDENISREIKCHVVVPESFAQKSRE